MNENNRKKAFDQKGECAKLRYSIGADILEKMRDNEDLPLPNVHRLSRVMQEYFEQEGHVDTLTERGHSWRPSEDYWRAHMSDVCAYLRKERKMFFVFVQEQGTFKGRWEFVDEQEFTDALTRNHADVGTRTETYNDKLSDGKARWEIELPGIARVPLLN